MPAVKTSYLTSYFQVLQPTEQRTTPYLKKAKNVYLPFISGTGDIPSTDVLTELSSISPIRLTGCISSKKAVFPLKTLLEVSKGTGDARGFPDKDGIFRKYALCTEIQGKILPSLALSIFPEDTILSVLNTYKNKTFVFPRFPSPKSFKTYSFMDVIYRHRNGLFHNALKNKIALVGATAPGLLDLRPTSISKNTPGMFLHGTIIENIKHKTFVKQASVSDIAVSTTIILIIFFLIFLTPHSLATKSLITTFFIVFLVAMDTILFSKINFFISPVILTIPPVLSYVLFVSFDYMVQDRERRFIKKLFRHYVSSELLDLLLKSPHRLQLGGERKTITIMFSDIASFTSFSEKLRPEEVVSILNRLLEDMSNIIMNEHGYIDKYEGDAIMAFWNAPVSVENHATCAIKAAIKCHEKLKKEINPSLEKLGFKPLNMRFGINTGEAVVGNIGSRKRFDYTAIGDSVNLASRLEGINKVYGTNIIVSEYTKERAEEESPSLFLFRELDYVRVKGKQKPVIIYEVTGFKESVSAETLRVIEQYEKALFYYRRGDFKKAKKILEKIAEGDRPSEVLLKRCLHLLKNPPATWDGIFTMTTK